MFSSKDFNPAIVLVGLEAIESLYHFAPFISFTNSSLCSTPGNLLIAFAWFSTFTNLLVAAIAAKVKENYEDLGIINDDTITLISKNKEKKDIKAMDIKLQNRAGRGTVVMVTDLDDEVVEANF